MVQEMRHAAFSARQMEGGMRAHQRPAQPRAFADRGIHIGDTRNPFRHQMHRFAPQCGLQAVRQMAGHFLFDFDRVLADGTIEFHCRLHGFGAALGAAHNLDQGDQMRRVEGVADHHAFGMRAKF